MKVGLSEFVGLAKVMKYSYIRGDRYVFKGDNILEVSSS
jgi:hypothetical protein